jgi:hypothetical protein
MRKRDADADAELQTRLHQELPFWWQENQNGTWRSNLMRDVAKAQRGCDDGHAGW